MDYKNPPYELFEARKSELIPLELNGIKTFALKMEDAIGKYFAIPAIDKNIQPLPEIIQGNFIKQIDFDTYQGKTAVLKAYY